MRTPPTHRPRSTRHGRFLGVAVFVLGLVPACASGPTQPDLLLDWEPLERFNADLPEGVQVYAGRNDELPLRAWHVKVEEPRPDLVTRVLVSDDDTDRRETVTSFARDSGACVVVNGGYFRTDLVPSEAVGLLVADGKILKPATRSVPREGKSFEIARAAIGFTEDDEITFGWITTREGILYSWPQPPAHRPGEPAPALEYDDAEVWEVHDAIGAGPALMVDGEIRITSNEEVFFGTTIPEIHPRTAVGKTADGALILLVVDGRQPISRGASLEELAALMFRLGAVDAINLDGGGSSTLVVNNVLLNRPAGTMVEREVMSAVAVFHDAAETIH